MNSDWQTSKKSLNDAQVLIKLKKEIEDTKNKYAQEQGKIEAAMTRLKDEFNLNNITDTETEINNLNKQIEKKQKKLQIGIKELQENFNL